MVILDLIPSKTIFIVLSHGIFAKNRLKNVLKKQFSWFLIRHILGKITLKRIFFAKKSFLSWFITICKRVV